MRTRSIFSPHTPPHFRPPLPTSCGLTWEPLTTLKSMISDERMCDEESLFSCKANKGLWSFAPSPSQPLVGRQKKTVATVSPSHTDPRLRRPSVRVPTVVPVTRPLRHRDRASLTRLAKSCAHCGTLLSVHLKSHFLFAGLFVAPEGSSPGCDSRRRTHP